MSRSPNLNHCEKAELACAYALRVLPASEVVTIQAHLAACPDCRRELENLQPVVDRFVSWPTDVLCPSTSLQARLALRIAGETGKPPVPPRRAEPEWKEVAPGIECQLLATDAERHRVSMLVRLAPGASYPGHITRLSLPGIDRDRIQVKNDNHTVHRTSRIANGRTAILRLRRLLQEGPRLTAAEYRLFKTELESLDLDLERNYRRAGRQ